MNIGALIQGAEFLINKKEQQQWTVDKIGQFKNVAINGCLLEKGC
jgi:hypothetical protein